MKKNGLIITVFLILLFGRFFLTSEPVANDLRLAYKDTFLQQFSLPQAWTSSNETLLMWNRPLIILSGLFGEFGLSFSLTMKLFILIGFLIFGVWGIRRLFKELHIDGWANMVGTILYLSNTYVLLILDGGQISIALVYAWFPISYLTVLKGISGNLKAKIVAGLSVGILGFLDIRFIYILLILLVIHFLYEFIFDNTKRSQSVTVRWVVTALVSGIVLFGLNFYWILPAVVSKAPALPAIYTRGSQTSFLGSTQFKHALFLLQPQWYLNVFGKIPPFRKEFLLIPILAFLAPILKRKDKRVWFWTVVAVVSVFLTKGANPPFPQVYPWLFTHVPGFSLFRDSTKFFFLVALSYSVLIGYTVDAIYSSYSSLQLFVRDYIFKKFAFADANWSLLNITKRFSKLRVIFPVFIIIYLLFLVRPVYLGQMTGTFSEPRYKTEYFSLASKLDADKNFGRIFWIPSETSLSFSSPIHPSVGASRLESLRPFEIATVGAFETQNFIREGNYMGELFDIAGIKYIAYPYFDPARDDMKQEKVDYYNTFLSQIGSLPWIGERISDLPIPVFKTIKNENKFFLSKNTYFIIGSDSVYREIYSLGAKFSDNALVFAEENSGLINQIEKVPQAKIILYDKTPIDLLISFADKSKFIFPSANLNFSPSAGSGSSSWWKREAADTVWWRDFLQQKYGIDNQDFDYGGGYSIAEGNRELKVQSEKLKVGNVLFARVMKSSRGGTIEFWQGNAKVGEINTKIVNPEKVKIDLIGHGEIPDKTFTYDKADFAGVEVGNLVADRDLTIKTSGEINVVNSLIAINENDLNHLEINVNTLYNDKRIIDWGKLNNTDKEKLLIEKSNASVSYKELSPTHYQIDIKGLTNPATLFFSETHDSGWQLNSQAAYPLYSLINGFTVSQDGEYDLYFAPQRYVVPGLVVSGITLTSCIMFLIWKRQSKAWRFALKKSS